MRYGALPIYFLSMNFLVLIGVASLVTGIMCVIEMLKREKLMCGSLAIISKEPLATATSNILHKPL